MGTILVLLAVLVIFVLASARWGYKSNDGPESQEWKRREQRAWPCAQTAPVSLHKRPAQWRVIARGTNPLSDDDCTHPMCA